MQNWFNGEAIRTYFNLNFTTGSYAKIISVAKYQIIKEHYETAERI